MTNNIEFIRKKVRKAKRKALDMCVNAQKGHITSALSCAEILAVLYYGIMRIDPKYPQWEKRDRFIMSKNHATLMQYPILADFGFFDEEELMTFSGGSGGEYDGTRVGSHSKLGFPGIDYAGGSLGIGLGVAAGLAYGIRESEIDARVYCLIGDGECYEGSVWESAMFASHNKLNNLTVILDRNQIAVTDFTEKMVRLEPLADKWESFGFNVFEANGHSISDLLKIFTDIRECSDERPAIIIANTIKGKGIDFLENAMFRHGIAPKPNEIDKAYSSLVTEVIK